MNRRLPIVITILIFFTGLFVFWGWQKSQQNKQYTKGTMTYGVIIHSPKMANFAETRRQHYIDHAKEGRRFYKSWASKHKDIIDSIKTTRPSDERRIIQLYSSLPGTEKEAGIPWGSLSDRYKSVEEVNDVNKYIFSWQPDKHESVIADNMPFAKASLQNNHDLPLACSVSGVGDKQIILWASGKITERSPTEKPITVKGKPLLLERDVEIVPAF